MIFKSHENPASVDQRILFDYSNFYPFPVWSRGSILQLLSIAEKD